MDEAMEFLPVISLSEANSDLSSIGDVGTDAAARAQPSGLAVKSNDVEGVGLVIVAVKLY